MILERGVELPSDRSPTSVQMSHLDRPDNRCQWQIVRLAAGSLRDLAAKAGAAVCRGAIALRQEPRRRLSRRCRWRLALVVDSADALAGKLRLAADQLAMPQSRIALEEQGILLPREAADGRTVAFVFPGQGSQYAGMLGDLVRQNPAAREAVREVDAALTLLGYPSFDEISADSDRLLGVDVLQDAVGHVVGRPDCISHAERPRYPARCREWP